MPFVTECPFCRGKMRVPDHAAGMSYPCARCGSSFTLSPQSNPLPGAAAPAGSAYRPFAVPEAPPELQKASSRTAEPEPESPWRAQVRSLPWVELAGAASFACVAAGLLAVSWPPAQRCVLPLAAAGAVLAAVGVFGAPHREKRASRVWASLGGALALVLALIILVSPGLLGMESTWGLRPPAEPPSTPPLAVTLTPGWAGRLEPYPDCLDASRLAFQQNDLRVQIKSVAIAPVPYKNPPRRAKSPEAALLITVRVSNVGAFRKHSYKSWSTPGGGLPAMVLRDDQGKALAPQEPAPGQEIVGQTLAASLPPGRHVDDLLVFEAPPSGARWLRLELPAAAVGLPGQVCFEINRSLITGAR